jgi:hypothetical protein
MAAPCLPPSDSAFTHSTVSGMSKTVFIPSVPAKSESDFEVRAASKLAGYRRFFGVLSVVRKTDGRQLFPFDGAAELGPFPSKVEALAAAQVYGEHIVAADLANPEL